MTDCINLRERYGKNYKIGHDESYQAEHGERGRTDDPWLLIIPCYNGHIFPWGGNRLAASTNHSGRIPAKLQRLGCCELAQDGDDGATLTFDVADFAKVAAIMRPKRKREMSPENKEKLLRASEKYRFRPGHGSKAGFSEQRRVATASKV